MTEPGYKIFTDLDGTLLYAENYSASSAFEALQYIRDADIPLIFVTSKTAMEIQRYRAKLKNRHPFICENGGGIYIPRGYFCGKPEEGKFEVIGLGTEYTLLKVQLKEAASRLKMELIGMSDMTDQEIMAYTGIDKEEVPLARQRGFDEPFVIKSGDPTGVAEKLGIYFDERGLSVVRGNRFYHLMGGSDKGAAIGVLLARWKEEFGAGWKSIGIGDSPNDIPMFKAVDIPIAVKKPPSPGHYDFDIRDFPGLRFAEGIGPTGWNEAVLGLLKSRVASEEES